MSEPIYTDANGKPFEKPLPEDYMRASEYFQAYWRYRDAIADCANKAFDEGFRKGLKKSRAKNG